MGEILWDFMPSGLYLGGAPYNVAYHLTQLGNDVAFVSRVGDDILGKEAMKRAQNSGLSVDLIQIDDVLDTGIVEVKLGGQGDPEYDIKKPAAWDEIELNAEVEEVIQAADAVLFGTLAQRNDTSKATIQSLEESDALKILDLNLRQPYLDKKVVCDSLEFTDILKVNDVELEELADWFNLADGQKESMRELAERFSLKAICLTLGGNGSILFYGDEFTEQRGLSIRVADTVGAGDAFLAALITGYLNQLPPKEMLQTANKLGAFVATCYGGTPIYSVNDLDKKMIL